MEKIVGIRLKTPKNIFIFIKNLLGLSINFFDEKSFQKASKIHPVYPSPWNLIIRL